MILWLKALGMCQSMFCTIPCPWHGWDEKARSKMLLCLPFIGLETGLLWWALSLLCRYLPELMAGAVTAVFPWVITGFMHLDGFMDVTDAVRSWRDQEKRREILKDSHVGAFAVIGCVILSILQFGCCAAFDEAVPAAMLIFVPVVSRCCAVLAINVLPPMQTSQYADRQKSRIDIIFPAVILIAAFAAGVLLFGCRAAVLAVEAGAFAIALHRAYRSLGGMNGDISGYCITLSELAACAALALTRLL